MGAARRSFLLIENPTAGINNSRKLDSTLEALTGLGAAVERVVTASGGDATRIAAEAARSNGIDAVIVAGGDGTIRECAAGLLGTDMPLGVVPAGTGNVMAGELRLPRTGPKLASYLVHGPARPVTGGLANGELFLLMAGIGIDAEIVARLDQARKRVAGKAAYAAPVLAALSATAGPHLDLMLDGTSHTSHWIVAARASRFGGRFRICRAAGLFAPELQFVTTTMHSRANRALAFAGLAAGVFEQMPGVSVRPGRTARITCSAPVPLQIDGDLRATTPVEITLASRQFSLIVPG